MYTGLLDLESSAPSPFWSPEHSRESRTTKEHPVHYDHSLHLSLLDAPSRLLTLLVPLFWGWWAGDRCSRHYLLCVPLYLFHLLCSFTLTYLPGLLRRCILYNAPPLYFTRDENFDERDVDADTSPPVGSHLAIHA